MDHGSNQTGIYRLGRLHSSAVQSRMGCEEGSKMVLTVTRKGAMPYPIWGGAAKFLLLPPRIDPFVLHSSLDSLLTSSVEGKDIHLSHSDSAGPQKALGGLGKTLL
jgi:hypothetical protein